MDTGAESDGDGRPVALERRVGGVDAEEHGHPDQQPQGGLELERRVLATVELAASGPALALVADGVERRLSHLVDALCRGVREPARARAIR